MANALTTTKRNSALALVPENLDQALRLADLMAGGDMIPDHLKGKAGNCLLIIEQAMHWHMSPFAVAQCSFFYKGKPGYEGKLVNAAVEAMGVITDEGFDDVYEGEGATRKLTLSATKIGWKRPRSIEVDFESAHTKDKDGKINQQWVKNPDQMLYYYAVRVWTRRYAPAVLLGVYTRQEIDNPDIVEHDGPTIDSTAEEQVEQAVAKAAEDVAARAAAEAAKPTVHTYQFTSLKSARAHSKAADWISDWTKLLEGYVAAAKTTGSYDDMRDRVQMVWKMNKGSLEAVVGFDYPSHQIVMDLIGSTLKALTPTPAAQTEQKGDTPREEITAAGETYIETQDSADAHGDRTEEADPDPRGGNEPTPEKRDPDGQRQNAPDARNPAVVFVEGLEQTLRTCVEEAAAGGVVGHSVAGGRASWEVNNKEVQSKLARMKREQMWTLYDRVLRACSDETIVDQVLSGSQNSGYEAFYYDLLRITEEETAV